MRKSGFDTGIHGLRGMAALAVFLFHCYDIPRKMDVFASVDKSAAFVFSLGAAGVDIFFIISGYLITSSLIRHGNIRTFFIDRFARIYPLFFIIHCLIFPLGPFIGYKWMSGIGFGDWILHFFSNAFLLPGVFNLPLLQLNAWSLSYEAFFYLISALLYVLIARSRVIFYVLSVAFVLMALWVYPRAVFFVVGIGAYLTKTHVPLRSWWTGPWVSLVYSISFLIPMGFALAGEGDWLFYIGAIPGYLFFCSVLAGTSWVQSLLASRPFQFLGDISYSFYLWHAVIAFPLKLVIFKFGFFRYGIPVWVAFAAWMISFVVVTLVVSWLSKLYIEDRGRVWVKSLLGRKASSQS